MGSKLLHDYAESQGITPADVHPWMVAALVETKDSRPPARPKRIKKPKPFWWWNWIAAQKAEQAED